MKTALILFAHGARESCWAEPFRAIRDRVAAARTDLTVEIAYLEFMTPSLAECAHRLAKTGHQRVTVAPLLFALGGHLKRDLPRMLEELRERHPGLAIEQLSPVGEVETLRAALAAWLVNATPGYAFDRS